MYASAPSESTSPGAPHFVDGIQPADLAEFASTKAALRLERLAADQRLINALMWRGYAGPEWDAFRVALAEYGYQVLLGWCLSGRIFHQCSRRGFADLPAPQKRIDRDDASELAAEAVATSLNYFRERVLVPGLWDPSRGASLKTYFVGTCIYGFVQVYRAWRRENVRLRLLGELDDVVACNGPDAQASARLNEVIARVAEPDRTLLPLVALGHTHDEIGGRLGRSRKAVERRVQRMRKRLEGL